MKYIFSLLSVLVLSTSYSFSQPLENGSFEEISCEEECPSTNSFYNGCSLPWHASHGQPRFLIQGHPQCYNQNEIPQDGDISVVLSTGGIFQSYDFISCETYRIKFYVKRFRDPLTGVSDNSSFVRVGLSKHLVNNYDIISSFGLTPQIPHQIIHSQSVTSENWELIEIEVESLLDWTQLWIYVDSPILYSSEGRSVVDLPNRMSLDNISVQKVECENELSGCDASFDYSFYDTGFGEALNINTTGNENPNPYWTITNIGTGTQYVFQDETSLVAYIDALCPEGSNCDLGIPSGTYEVCLIVGKELGGYSCFDEVCKTIEVVSNNFNSNFHKEEGVLSDQSGINIYPNPSNDLFSIDSELSLKRVSVYNSIGGLIKTSKTNLNKVSLLDQPNGTYFIKVEYTDHNDLIDSRILKVQKH